MKTLLLIPSVLKTGVENAVRHGDHPRMDYHALAGELRQGQGHADLVGYAEVDADSHPLVRLTRRLAGRDAALAMVGFLRGAKYDAIFTNGENVAIPLALLLRNKRRRPAHVTIGHRPSTGKKRLFFGSLRVHDQIDSILLYATTQHDFARSELRITPQKLRRIEFHADEQFFKPRPQIPVNPAQICAAGLEWRDYPTLIAAMESLPDLELRIAAASPWSKHRNETEARTLPPNVSAKRYAYNELRDLYAASAIVAVPLYENDFQAGVTTLLEAMAMGKAVIVTRTTGQTDIITDGVNGLCVAVGDVDGWFEAIRRLQNDVALRIQLGTNALRWVHEHATLNRWSGEITAALRNATAAMRRPDGFTGNAPRTSPDTLPDSVLQRSLSK
ncbi:MAG: glycosyltransferase family 4 protein [Akkermansiaceae bacterium]|nr:glycosyltransferase family 4 protein [Armatimonadota bacterium]